MAGFGQINNKKKKPKRELIVDCQNSAIQHYQNGNLLKARDACRVVISKNPKNAFFIGFLATIEKNLGNSEESERLFLDSLRIAPDQSDILNNYAGLLIIKKEFKIAAQALGRAISINPQVAAYYERIGYALWKLGEHDKAIESSLKAISLNPQLLDAHLLHGNILHDQGKNDGALSAILKVIEIQPDYAEAYSALGFILKEINTLTINNVLLGQAYEALIGRKDLMHRSFVKIFIDLYTLNIDNILKHDELNILNNEYILALADDMRFKKSLSLFVVPSLDFEKCLARIRKKTLSHAVETKHIHQKILPLIEVLAIQCFLNEYIYETSNSELEDLQILIDGCQENNEMGLAVLPIIACYVQLNTFAKKINYINDYIPIREESRWLYQILLKEPQKEDELSKDIINIGKIGDKVSMAVKAQYEVNPYPRWRFADFSTESSRKSALDWIRLETGNQQCASRSSINKENKIRILIAGCGTGNQLINASRYKNAEITAIDLSIKSLSYSKRKALEYDMGNVEFIMMDLLELHLLNKKYDVIECGGVLHHMNDPSEGLTRLADRLVKGGYMKLGLYSAKARKDVIAARQFIETLNIEPTPNGVRQFRKAVSHSKSGYLGSLHIGNLNFFSTSECIDNYFHVQEHLFTTDSLSRLLETSNLKFCGFMVSNDIRNSFMEQFPADSAMLDLRHWGEYEEQYPLTFKGMYQFWVCKN